MRHKRRILFLAEGITMAHFTRPAMLAESLDPAEWELFFRTPKRFHELLRLPFGQIGDLQTLDPGVFLDLLARGGVLYSLDTLRQYVEEELELFREIQPDLVVGDYRLSLSVSAPLSKVPFASIFNAYWSPFRTQPAIVPELPVSQWISPSILNRIYGVLRPLFYAYHARPLNQLRRAFGLPRLHRDPRDFYTAGDLVLYPDVPEFVPLRGAPSHHHFIGTCLWTGVSTKPAWWDDALASPYPRVLVALGSSGPLKALSAVLDALSRLPVTVMVATSGREIGKVSSNIYVADLLPYEEATGQCALVISHGGSSGVYPALSTATPVLAIPANIDTHLSAALLEESGAGLAIRVERATAERLGAAVDQLLSQSDFKKAATKWAATIASYDTRKIFPDLLRRWFER